MNLYIMTLCIYKRVALSCHYTDIKWSSMNLEIYLCTLPHYHRHLATFPTDTPPHPVKHTSPPTTSSQITQALVMTSWPLPHSVSPSFARVPTTPPICSQVSHHAVLRTRCGVTSACPPHNPSAPPIPPPSPTCAFIHICAVLFFIRPL